MDTTSSSSTPTQRSPQTAHPLHSPTNYSPLLVLTRTTRPAFLPYYGLFLTFLVCTFLLASIPRRPPPLASGSPASMAALLSRQFVALAPPSLYQDKGGSFGDGDGDSSGTRRKEKRGGKKEGWLRKMKGCDLYGGRWVRDEAGGGYPLYGQGSCPLIDEAFDCFGNGRSDSAYAMYRWQPFDCDIPR